LFEVADNIKLLPLQIGFSAAAINIEGVTLVVVVIVKAFDVAVVVDKQLALLVNTAVITSLFANVVLVYVEALVPTFTPFNFH
jgi:hypothetical protein